MKNTRQQPNVFSGEWEAADSARDADYWHRHNLAAAMGVKARRDGKPIEACPAYTDQKLAATWRIGWTAADMEISGVF